MKQQNFQAQILIELEKLRLEVSELRSLVEPKRAIIQDNTLLERVTKALLDMHIRPQLLGYRYLREAILFVYHNTNSYNQYTKVIYPDIAKKFNTTPTRVERGIRHAIETSYYKNECFQFSEKKPSNSEFISYIVDQLQMEDIRKRVKV